MDHDFDYFDNRSDAFNGTGNATLSSYPFEDYVFPPLLLLIGVVGLLGNGALVFILHKTNARSPPNALILSLALADLIVILFYMPFAAFSAFPFGDAVCKASEGLNDVSLGVTAFALIVLIVYCFFETSPTPQRDWTQRSAVVAVASVWALAVSFALPTLLFAHVLHADDEAGTAFCYSFDPRFETRQGPLRFAVYYAIPLMAFAFLYCIARLSGAVNRLTTAQREVSKLTVWLLAVYAACFFVVNMTTFWIVLPDDEHEFWHVLDVTGFYLALLYRCVNPIVLYCVSDNFRQHFDRYLLCWCAKGNREPDGEAEINRIRC